MEAVLLVITLVSIAVALVALLSSRRVQQRDRERSEARVAALAAAAEGQPGAERPWTLGPAPEAIPNPEPLLAVSSERFFGTVERDEPPSGRLVLAGAAALIVTLGGALIFLNTPAANDRAAAHVPYAQPLELVALGHARDMNVLTISGTVRNPSSRTKLEGLTAVVSLLDFDGGLVSTKDVPLDYRALGPGDEAPFKVSIPDPGSIARYRVSFRAGTAVVPHVDRRDDTRVASANR